MSTVDRIFAIMLCTSLISCRSNNEELSETKIIGGEDFYSRSDTVQIVAQNGSSCTATYVSRQIFLTAGHCIPGAFEEGGPITIRRNKNRYDHTGKLWENEEVTLNIDRIWSEWNLDFSSVIDGVADPAHLDGRSDFAFILVNYGSTIEEIFETSHFFSDLNNVNFATPRFGTPTQSQPGIVVGWGKQDDQDLAF